MKNHWFYKQSDKKADMKSTSVLNFQLLFLFYKNSTKFLIVLFACLIFWCSYGYTAGGSESSVKETPELVVTNIPGLTIDTYRIIVQILLNSESLSPETTAKISGLEIKPYQEGTIKILIDSGVLSRETVVKIREATRNMSYSALSEIDSPAQAQDAQRRVRHMEFPIGSPAQAQDALSNSQKSHLIKLVLFIYKNLVLDILQADGVLSNEAYAKVFRIINDEVNQKR